MPYNTLSCARTGQRRRAVLCLLLAFGVSACGASQTNVVKLDNAQNPKAKNAKLANKTAAPQDTPPEEPPADVLTAPTQPNAPAPGNAAPANAKAPSELWRAEIGQTTYRSTIHVSQGQVIVNSNGEDLNAKRDRLDGVHVLNAATGSRLMQIVPPGGGEKDANGLAVTRQGLFFGTDQEVFYAYDRQGKLVWSFEGKGDFEAAPAMADFNGDQILDVAVGEEDGDFYLLDGRTGKPIRVFKTETGDYGQTGYNAPAAVMDVNGDHIPEIFVPGRDNTMKAFDGRTGTQLWRIKRDSGLHGAPILVDVNGDGTRELVFSEAYSEIMVVEPRSGKVVWSQLLTHPTGGIEGLFSPLGWFDADRCALTGTAWWGSRESFYCVGASGVVWRHEEAKKNISSGAVVGDVDGKPGDEVIFGTESGKLVAVGQGGAVVWTVDLGAPIECTPTLADVDGDGTTEVLVAAGDGFIRAFKTAGASPIAHPYHRGDSANTGQW